MTLQDNTLLAENISLMIFYYYMFPSVYSNKWNLWNIEWLQVSNKFDNCLPETSQDTSEYSNVLYIMKGFFRKHQDLVQFNISLGVKVITFKFVTELYKLVLQISLKHQPLFHSFQYLNYQFLLSLMCSFQWLDK